MKSPKEILQERFSNEHEKYYRVELFNREGFLRKKCPNCGKHFWTLKPERKVCDDSTCSPYAFIGDPPTKKRLDYISSWRTVEKFFVKNGHTSVPRYPVVSRWRPDLFFTVASIVDFQRIEAGKVVFFPDIYADYNDPQLGVRAFRVLLALGYRVEVPQMRWSGMPYISYGDIGKATAVAKKNLDALEPYLDQGYSVVSTEPTAVYMFREVYPTLAPGRLAEKARELSFPFFGFIQDGLRTLALKPAYPTGEAIGFHIPCHERSVSGGRPAVEFLKAAGYDVQVVENGTCCGMAGTFGMKRGDLGYNLSMEVGDHLFRLFRESGRKLVATESSVCSMQISDGVGVKVVHPLRAVEEVSSSPPS